MKCTLDLERSKSSAQGKVRAFLFKISWNTLPAVRTAQQGQEGQAASQQPSEGCHFK